MRIAHPLASRVLLTVSFTLFGLGLTSNAAGIHGTDRVPQISAVTPRTLAPSAQPQTVTVLGTGFEEHLALTVTTPEGRSMEYRDDQIQSFRATSFAVSIEFGIPGRYLLVVANQDGLTSDAFAVDVRRDEKPSTPAPAIDRILPEEIVAGQDAQSLTIEGRGFDSDVWVIVTNPIGEEVVDAVVRDVTSTSFTLNVRLELAGVYELVITTRSGGVSNTATIMVR